MAWQTLKIQASLESAEVLSDALMELGALSVSIEDADAETLNEQPVFGEPGEPPPGMWQHNVVSALFPPDAALDPLMLTLEEATDLGPLTYSIEVLEEQDWVRATQSQFEPIRIRDDLWIVPTWHAAPQLDALNIVLDPGLAFGTGSHPTTHLCLAWLADNIQGGESVLDYGCGSGILAIAAKMRGAGDVYGVDIDPFAIQASVDNATQNHVEIQFSLPDAHDFVPADVVVANILASPLKVLAPMLASSCKAGGKIALSGILREQAEEVMAIYQEWFEMQAPTPLENWVLLRGIKR